MRSSTRAYKPVASLRRELTGWGFAAPTIIGFLVFFAIPICWSLYIGFTNWDGFSEPRWVGFKNYAGFLLRNPLALSDPPHYFWKSLKNTLYYCIGSIPISITLALVFAFLLNSGVRGIKVFRGLFFLPVVSSVVAVSVLWRWIFAPDYGPLNYLLVSIGGEAWRLGWLGSSKWAMPAIIIMAIWRTMGFNIIVFLAALQGVPNELREAAVIDGASESVTARKIILPLLTPSIFFIAMNSAISGLQLFNEVYVMTDGGPARATQSVVYSLYQQGFSFFQPGMASAMGWTLFIIILAVTIIQNRLSRRWVFYGEG